MNNEIRINVGENIPDFSRFLNKDRINNIAFLDEDFDYKYFDKRL
jgi:hypothetical protein